MAPLAKERLTPISSDRDFTEGGPRHKIQMEKKSPRPSSLKGTVVSDFDCLS